MFIFFCPDFKLGLTMLVWSPGAYCSFAKMGTEWPDLSKRNFFKFCLSSQEILVESGRDLVFIVDIINNSRGRIQLLQL